MGAAGARADALTAPAVRDPIGAPRGVPAGARILTAELDQRLAGAASEIFADDPAVEVLAADWSTLQSHITQQGADTLITLDADDVITLTNVQASSLTSAQFKFV